MFSSLCSGRRWQESLEDLRPSRAGAPPDPGIQAAYPCRGRERIEDLPWRVRPDIDVRAYFFRLKKYLVFSETVC